MAHLMDDVTPCDSVDEASRWRWCRPAYQAVPACWTGIALKSGRPLRRSDRTELHNLAAQMPQKAKQLVDIDNARASKSDMPIVE